MGVSGRGYLCWSKISNSSWSIRNGARRGKSRTRRKLGRLPSRRKLLANQEREARQQAQRDTTEAYRLDGLARPYTNSATSTRGGRGGLTTSGSSASSAPFSAPAARVTDGPKKQIKQCFVCHTPLENPVKCGAKSCRTVACDQEACQTAFKRRRENAHTT